MLQCRKVERVEFDQIDLAFAPQSEVGCKGIKRFAAARGQNEVLAAEFGYDRLGDGRFGP